METFCLNYQSVWQHFKNINLSWIGVNGNQDASKHQMDVKEIPT